MKTKYYRNNLRFTAVFHDNKFIEVRQLNNCWMVNHGKNAFMVDDSRKNDVKSTKQEFDAVLRQAQDELRQFLHQVAIDNKETPSIMHFRDVAQMSELVDGDRFYLAGDAKKDVLVMMSMKSRKIVGGYSYTATVRPASIQDKPGASEQTKVNSERQFKEAENVKIVFLRHKEAIA